MKFLLFSFFIKTLFIIIIILSYKSYNYKDNHETQTWKIKIITTTHNFEKKLDKLLYFLHTEHTYLDLEIKKLLLLTQLLCA